MRYSAAEKLEIIQLVGQSNLPQRRCLASGRVQMHTSALAHPLATDLNAEIPGIFRCNPIDRNFAMFSHNRDTTLDTTSTLKTKQIAQALQTPENAISSKVLTATEGKRRKDATLREEGECSHEESNLKPSDP